MEMCDLARTKVNRGRGSGAAEEAGWKPAPRRGDRETARDSGSTTRVDGVRDKIRSAVPRGDLSRAYTRRTVSVGSQFADAAPIMQENYFRNSQIVRIGEKSSRVLHLDGASKRKRKPGGRGLFAVRRLDKSGACCSTSPPLNYRKKRARQDTIWRYFFSKSSKKFEANSCHDSIKEHRRVGRTIPRSEAELRAAAFPNGAWERETRSGLA
jgi:hypothetical protein